MSQTDIVIEKNVPLPKRSRIPALPLDEMSVGDSFVLELEEGNPRNTVRQRLQRYQRANVPKRFSMIAIDDDRVRIHRIEDYTQRQMLRKCL